MINPTFPFSIPVEIYVGAAASFSTARAKWASSIAGDAEVYDLIVLDQDSGSFNAGLYVFHNSRWNLAIPYANINDFVISGGSAAVYVDLTTNKTPLAGSTVFQNGVQSTATTLTASTSIIWATIFTNPSTGAVVTSFNARTGAVALTAADVAAVLAPATATTIGGVIVPAASGLTVDASGNLGLNLATGLSITSNKLTPAVASIAGTVNEITVSNVSGVVTLSTPQPIATVSSPTFVTLTLTTDALVNGNVNVKGNVSSTGNTNPASPTNSGVALSAAPNVADVIFYDSTQTANNRTWEWIYFQGSFQARAKNDAGNAALSALAIAGGQTGITGITSSSGSGAWAHTGSMTISAGATITGNVTVANSGAGNGVAITSAATGNGPVISTAGSDTNVDLNVTPKGTGAIKLNANTTVTGTVSASGVINSSVGLTVKEGANTKQGIATLVAGTVTVANTSVTANSRIFLTIQSLGTVTSPQAIGVTARVAGTSFTITSAGGTDTSVIAYEIFEPGV